MIKRFIPTQRGYKCRIYPSDKQKEIIKKTIGYSRWIYNHFLDKAKTNRYESKTKYIREIPALKREYNWLKEADSIALQQAVRDLDTAFKNFFKGEQNFPKFKSKKKSRLSYRTQYFKRPSGIESIEINGNQIKLPKVGWIKFKNYKEEDFNGKLQNVTVSKSRAGDYYISIIVKQIKVTKAYYSNQEVGIDLGLKDFAILSNDEKIENPRHLEKYEDKLTKLQKRLALKEKGSNNWKKLKSKIAKVHEKIKNVRKDFLHKLSTRLTRENQLIAIEDLNIEGMLKNSKLAKHIADVSWSKFTTMLEYKAKWYNCLIEKIDRFFASSQACSNCGTKNPEVKDLNVRTWTCGECETTWDRDKNASLNILQEAKKQLAT